MVIWLMFSISSMFSMSSSIFTMFSMFSHTGWQDGTICGALSAASSPPPPSPSSQGGGSDIEQDQEGRGGGWGGWRVEVCCHGYGQVGLPFRNEFSTIFRLCLVVFLAFTLILSLAVFCSAPHVIVP